MKKNCLQSVYGATTSPYFWSMEGPPLPGFAATEERNFFGRQNESVNAASYLYSIHRVAQKNGAS